VDLSRCENHLNNLEGLVLRRLKFPFFNRDLSGVYQHRIPAQHACRFNAAIGVHDSFNPNDSLKVHPSGELGIVRSNARDHLSSIARGRSRLLGERRSGYSQNGEGGEAGKTQIGKLRHSSPEYRVKWAAGPSKTPKALDFGLRRLRGR